MRFPMGRIKRLAAVPAGSFLAGLDGIDATSCD
jgi:hypothetical protein